LPKSLTGPFPGPKPRRRKSLVDQAVATRSSGATVQAATG
jgi:hypothetical protein